MLATTFLLVVSAVAVCALGIRSAFRLLGLEPMETLLWLGVAEMPAGQPERAVRRRR